MLMYRFPGKEVVRKKGRFREVTSFSEITEGFVVKPFGDLGVFLFQENENEPDEWFESDRPIATDKETYIQSASSAMNELQTGKLQKVVISRIKSTAFDFTSVQEVFKRLEEAYPNAFVYLLSSPILGTWLGASPEILLNRDAKQFFISSLAGTKKALDVSEWRGKEVHEQQLVTEYITSLLGEMQVTNFQVKGPNDLIAGPVKHLFTEFTGETILSSAHMLDKLHPTPAVAGLPKQEALDFIREHEQHNRDLYAGIIGYYSQEVTSLYVNLRCAQLSRNQAFLYLGGGLTAQSNVAEEWQETENKAKTLEKIFQLTSFT
jgi:isochorismate synthase